MDSHLIFLTLIGILIKVAPWLLLGTAGAVFLSRSALGKAMMDRFREGSAGGEELAALAGELEQMRRELSELQERVDFTERLVSQPRDVLPPSTPSRAHTPTPPEPAPAGHR